MVLPARSTTPDEFLGVPTELWWALHTLQRRAEDFDQPIEVHSTFDGDHMAWEAGAVSMRLEMLIESVGDLMDAVRKVTARAKLGK